MSATRNQWVIAEERKCVLLFLIFFGSYSVLYSKSGWGLLPLLSSSISTLPH